MRRYVLAVCLALFVAASVRFGIDHYEWMQTSAYENGRALGYYEGEMKQHVFVKRLIQTANGRPVYFRLIDRGYKWQIGQPPEPEKSILPPLFRSPYIHQFESGNTQQYIQFKKIPMTPIVWHLSRGGLQ